MKKVKSKEIGNKGDERNKFFRPLKVLGIQPDQLSYRDDPDFQELLIAFQNAQWVSCQERINHLLEKFPEDEYLESLMAEVEVRLNLQEESLKVQKQENKKRFLKIGLQVLLVLIVIIITGWLYLNTQSQVIQSNQQQRATEQMQSLMSKFQNAENLMRAGKSLEALYIFTEIQSLDPPVSLDIEGKIEDAQNAIYIENLYQQGVQAASEGRNDQALSLFLEVENLSTKYKDTQQLIEQTQHRLLIESLSQDLQDAYDRKDWVSVALTYDAIKEIDPFLDLLEMKEMLFVSYHNLVIDILSQEKPTLEEIENADRYYQMAFSLFPQNKDFAIERVSLHEKAIELLVSKYYLYSINLLESSNYSFQSLAEAIRILNKVKNISGGSPLISKEIEKAQLFIDSYNHFIKHEYDQALTGFEELRRKEANYAQGKVNYLLFESYQATGDAFYKYANFQKAFEMYQEAEKYAWRDTSKILRLFEVELRLAGTMNRLWNVDDAASYYHYAFNRLDYNKSLSEINDFDLSEMITKANDAYLEGKMLDAVSYYRTITESKYKLFEYETILVNRGVSLPDLAYQYGCTIEILQDINQLGERLLLSSDQEILVPKGEIYNK